MFFPARLLRAIEDGTVDRAFRRWAQPRVRAGGRQRTGAGVIGFDAIEVVERDELTEEDARGAGYAALPDLVRYLDSRESGTIFRIRLHFAGPDPRAALRDSLPDAPEIRDIERRLARLDRASRHGPWTHAVLRAIRDHPGLRAADLAATFSRETQPFKTDVRKLKELGLTESLRPGYRLSPRGRATLASLGEA